MAIFESTRGLIEETEKSGLPIWEYVLKTSCEESNISEEQSWEMMGKTFDAMLESYRSYDQFQVSASGLVGGDAEKMRVARNSGDTICGSFIGSVIATALTVSECNACMHRIVAAPTAGSCGVLPAVLLPYAHVKDLSRDDLIKALYVASGFGAVIAQRASISGAEAGCQAEIGSASAMAAAALVYLHGGDLRMMENSVAMALKNMMGLVCDPVAGLVEVPCVKRNVAGAMNALASAEMALAGIESRIPADEVIDTMKVVGSMLPPSLRETGEGGIAASPTAHRLFPDGPKI
ncbi:MAG: L-serine ammonia-lyase, iron-sulfur-dependent, subunit alpha [Firmicutes bacterium]|nr:L-serine ammonia-lyase, iron-sulfur-dependent, subunit alpha [Bacillota bacterium]